MKPRLLFVEDDATFRGVMARELEGFGYVVTAESTAEDALVALRETPADLALIDLRLPGMNGLELLAEIKGLRPNLPVVLLTGHGTLADAVAAVRAGAYDFLGKPASLDELELTLKRALERRQLVKRNRLLKSLIDRANGEEILGESAAILALRQQIERIAASEANVLIAGESGTGKELVARALHEGSARHEAAFVVVNCGAIPAELFESELFGHDRGAFTGASQKRLGLIALADGGTLFLDEIGELPMALQPALLRAVQFGEYRPVGSDRTEQADVRLVAATNRDLEDRIEAGAFREDLYHRISTLSLQVPPLRERDGDVELLAGAFLRRHQESLPEVEQRRLSPAALEVLRRQEWRGNVRELENVIVRLHTLADGAEIAAGDVEKQLRPTPAAMPRELFTMDLETLERAAVLQALRRHAGNRGRAAAELGVATKTLYNKIKQHGIAPEEWGVTG